MEGVVGRSQPLQHQAEGGIEPAEQRHLPAGERAGIGVGEAAGRQGQLGQHPQPCEPARSPGRARGHFAAEQEHLRGLGPPGQEPLRIRQGQGIGQGVMRIGWATEAAIAALVEAAVGGHQGEARAPGDPAAADQPAPATTFFMNPPS